MVRIRGSPLAPPDRGLVGVDVNVDADGRAAHRRGACDARPRADVPTWQAWPDRVGWMSCRLGDDASAGAFDAYAIARAIVQAIPGTSFRIVEDRSSGELSGATICIGPRSAS